MRRLVLLGAVALVAASCGGGTKVALGPDTIAYVSTGGGDYAVYLVDAAAGKPKRLTKNPELGKEPAGRRFQDAPAWSPDGTQLAFDSNRDGIYRLFLLDASSGKERALGVEGADPSFSPDGTRLVFDGPAGGLSTVLVAGVGMRTVTPAGRPDIDPAWSPDGKQIVFVRRRALEGRLWLVGADGHGAHRLTKSTADETTPSWSPDGRWIAFSSNQTGVHQIYVIHPDGSGLRRVTVSATDNLHPTWSPDGKRIAYARAEGLFTIDAGGTGSAQVVSGQILVPAWRG